jgi:DNA-binding CsgD family transcriptional regulator/tetratricopeptide (TPR) repeat protein
MAETALLAGYRDEAAEVLDAALTADAPLGRCRPVQALLALRRGDYTAALTFGREALELAQAGESTDQIFRAYDVIVQCLNVLGRRADAVATSETWVARARCDGGVGALVHALVSLGGARLVADEPIDALWEARDLARDAGLFIELAWVNLNLAWAVWWRRPIAEAVALVDDAVRNARELRIDVLPYLLAVQGLIYESRRRGSGRQMVEESRRGFPSDPNRELILLAVDGALAELRGAYEEALGLYRRCVVLMRATPGSTPTGSPSEVPLMLLALGQHEEARGALADAAAWPGQALLNTARPFMRLATAALENRPQDVLPALAPIAENYPFERAIKLMIAAHLFPAADARVDWLQDALRTFEQGGWEAAAEVRRTLRAAGVRVASGPRRRAGLPDALAERGVTEREATVISLVVAGQSNREIAAALFLSVRTVESHVSSLMRKFGVSTRAELMARARDVL